MVRTIIPFPTSYQPPEPMSDPDRDPSPFDIYREAGEATVHSMVELEMREACRFLFQWRMYYPAIAGGALWSWAAGERAADVDIFIRHSLLRRAKRRCRRIYGEPLNYPIGATRMKSVGAYPGTTEKVRDQTARFVAYLPQSSTKVDLVVTRWRGLEAVDHFDYVHCMVAFAPNGRVTRGLQHYANGRLEACHNAPRPTELIKGKLRQTLWGQWWAPQRLLHVLDQLDDHYAEVMVE